jgi:Rieske Fe-S protein
MKRKEFVKKTGAAALLMSMGVLLNSCNDESEDIDIDDGNDDDASKISFNLSQSPFNTLQNVDGWLLHPDENILIVNVDGNIRAFTSVCTHSGCNDNWEYDSAQCRCTCHGSMFNNKGEVTQGPATGNLKEFNVSVDEQNVEIAIS